MREDRGLRAVNAPHVAWAGPGSTTRARRLLPSGAPLSVGRSPAMDIVLTGDPTVSALHAQLDHVSGQWLVADDGLSRNGTRVNGHPVAGRRRLRPGDRLQLGRTELVFHTANGETRGEGPDVAVAPSAAHRKVLDLLAGPLADDPQALPATDTAIASALGLEVPVVRHAVAELLVWFAIDDADRGHGRVRLGRIARELTPPEERS
jgi:pSer/pThr/pTyr-binding forkhead associated (FHA) protein